MAHKKLFTAFLVSLMVVGLLSSLSAVHAQSVPKPSVPDFSLELDGDFLSVTVKNQPVISNGHDTALIAYDFRFKWHESNNWPNEVVTTEGHFTKQTNIAGTTHWCYSVNTFSEILGQTSSHQLDCQMRAISGYLNSSIMYSSPIGGVDPNDQPVTIVTASEWSDTQTITLQVESSGNYPVKITPPTPTSLTSLSPSPIPTGTLPHHFEGEISDWLQVATVALLAVIAVLLALTVFYLRKRSLK